MRDSLRPRRATEVPGLGGVRAALAAACVTGCLVGAGCKSGDDASGAGAANAPAAAPAAESVVRAPARPANERYDPLQGDYPAVQWMVNLWEADAPLPPGDRPSRRVIEASAVAKTMEAAQALPGSSLTAAPCIMTKPGQRASLTTQSRDKAGQSVGSTELSIRSALDGDIVEASDVTINGHRFPASRIAKDGALVLCEPSAHGKGRWTIALLRPTVLRSVNDYPFQTADAPSAGGAGNRSN